MPIIRNLDAYCARKAASDREVARLSGMTIEEYDADVTAPDPLRDAAERMAERLSFNAYCREYGIDAARENFWWHLVSHGYTPGEALAAWQWETYWQGFRAADERDTHADALV